MHTAVLNLMCLQDEQYTLLESLCEIVDVIEAHCCVVMKKGKLENLEHSINFSRVQTFRSIDL